MNNFFMNLTSWKVIKAKHLAKRIGRIMEAYKTESGAKTYVPYRYQVFFSEEDWARVEPTFPSMTADLIEFIHRHTSKHDFHLQAEPEIEYAIRPKLAAGEFHVEPIFEKNDQTVDQINTMVFNKEDIVELRETVKSKSTPSVVLEVLHGNDVGMKYDLTGSVVTLGRKEDNQVMINDPNVSRYHARIRQDKEWEIEDLKSTNGIFVNGKKVKKSPLVPEDEIKIGSTLLKFRIE